MTAGVPNGTVDVFRSEQVATGEIPQFEAGQGSTGQISQLTKGRGETSHVETDPRGKPFHVEPGRAEFPHASSSPKAWGDSPRQPSKLDSPAGVSDDTVAGGGESPSATPQRIEDLIVVTYWHNGKQVS